MTQKLIKTPSLSRIPTISGLIAESNSGGNLVNNTKTIPVYQKIFINSPYVIATNIWRIILRKEQKESDPSIIQPETTTNINTYKTKKTKAYEVEWGYFVDPSRLYYPDDRQRSYSSTSIIPFLKPIKESKGMSGLFSNPNYAASWLIVIWPIALGAFLSNFKASLKGFISSVTVILFFVSILLTNSKDTWLALFIPIPFLIKLVFLRYLILFLFVLGTVFILPKNYFLKINEYSIFTLIFNSNLENNLQNVIDYFPRLDIWRVSIIAIFEKPFFGWGAASFPLIYSLYKMNFVNDKIQHSHNLFFETSISYGIIFSTIIFILFFRLLYDSWKVIFNKNGDLINKSLWLATLLFIINHMFDVTYYDIRLSMIFWILLASLESIIKEEPLTNNLEIKSN